MLITEEVFEVALSKFRDQILAYINAATSSGGSSHGGSHGGGDNPTHQVWVEGTPMTTWGEDFSDGVANVTNDANGWYDLADDDGKLQAILREPNNSSIFATFTIAIGKELDLTDGAYLSFDLRSYASEVNSANAVSGASWNDNNCMSLRLVDKNGNVSNWVSVKNNGIGVSGSSAISSSSTKNFSRTDISSYIPSSGFDRSAVVGIEISLIGWQDGSQSISYKARNKGVWIDNIILSRNSTETVAEGAGTEGHYETVNVTYRRVSASYQSLSTSNFNDASDVYDSVDTAHGDRVIFIVRHGERDSSSGKDSGLNSNGRSDVHTYATSKLTGAPFADATNDAYYSTNIKRTVETSWIVSYVRGSTANSDIRTNGLSSDWETISTEVNHTGDTESSLSAISSVTGPHTYFNDHFTGETGWATSQNYYKNSKSTCTTKCEEAINWLVEASDGHPFTFLTSHDLCLVPLVCWATDNEDFFSTWNNDYDSNPSGWLMYLAGISVIVHPDGGWEVYPVCIMDSGKFA